MNHWSTLLLGLSKPIERYKVMTGWK